MAVKRLEINILEEFFLWGLLAGPGGHRVCWEMNRAFGIEMARQDDIVVERRPEAEDVFFSYYAFEDPVSFIRYEMIRNQCSGEYFSRELKHFDYLLMVKGEIDFFEPAPFTSGLNRLSCIRSAMAIELNKIKHPEILILE